MQRRLLFIFLSLTLSSNIVLASEATGCIKAASRTSPCPNQIYRAMQLPGMDKPALRCICVTDFSLLLQEPQTPEQRLAQLRLRQQFKTELQHDIEPILQILRRER